MKQQSELSWSKKINASLWACLECGWIDTNKHYSHLVTKRGNSISNFVRWKKFVFHWVDAMCDAEGVAKQYCFKNLNQLWTSGNAKQHWSHGKSLSSLYTESFIFSLFDLFLSVWSIVMHSFEKIDYWDYLLKKTIGVSNTTPSALLRDWDLIN